MLICATCSSEVLPAAQQCSRCGGRTFSSIAPPAETMLVSPLPRAGSAVAESFTTGELVAERYRIVGLLGRGGMGEVYRAEDLTLAQPVALKFLPRFDVSPDLVDRLRGEVRVTRQVSHPNVCRVYDIGLAGGRHFLSMEYVDGEDLASLLRRIGRLPADKALDIARQLCAGLAAAHDLGVIHRDLKPSNVMLDGRGKVRIADFGLAIVAHGEGTTADRAGTPAYMAPEQLEGHELSVQTDIYALGLIIYELFTGRRLFDARTLDDLRAAQRDLVRLRSSASDLHLDPAIERVVMRCVEFDAARRPASALAVSAALPGGDPLAAALAAGETPSPQLVAAAGDGTSIAPVATIALALAAVIGCGVAAASTASRSAFALLRPPYSADVLDVKANEMLQRLRPGETYASSANGFEVDSAFVRFASRKPSSREIWARLPETKPPAVYFWRRAAPRPMWPRELPGGKRVTENDPPRLVPGTTLIRTDVSGRLVYLDVRASLRDETAPAAPPPWAQLFTEAGLDASRFTPAAAEWLPPSWGDARAAWTGSAGSAPETPLRIEAAAYRGRPTFFVVAAPWTARPDSETASGPARSAGERWFAISLLVMLAAALVAAGAMAVRGVRSGRADLRGAMRLTLFVGVSQLVSTLLVMTHAADIAEGPMLLGALGWPVACAVSVWALYVALEPYLRRMWPSSLISWNRVLEGRIRDVRVARDVLVGAAVTGLIDVLEPLVSRVAVAAPRGIVASYWRQATSMRELLAGLINTVDEALFIAFLLVFLFAVVRMAVRRDWIAASVFALVSAIVVGGASAAAIGGGAAATFVLVVGGLLVGALTALLLVRFGLVAVIAQVLTDALLTGVVALTPSAWYATASWFEFAAVIAIAIAAAWICLSMRPAGAAVPQRALS